jgi:hypothetical protein
MALTVKELIKILSELPDTMEIHIEHREGSIGLSAECIDYCITTDEEDFPDNITLTAEIN